MTLRPHLREWLFSLALYVPAALYFTAHFSAKALNPDRIGTGFIQYDQPSYMASAREFIGGSMYGLPHANTYDTEPALVQVHLWALSVAWPITGIDPGVLFALFGILSIRVFLLVFDAVVPVHGSVRHWGQPLFVWGGGGLCLAGRIPSYMQGARGDFVPVGDARSIHGELPGTPGYTPLMPNMR